MVTLTYTISDAKLAEFKIGFLARFPNTSELTDNQWIRAWGLNQFKETYMAGKRILAQHTVSIDVDIIE